MASNAPTLNEIIAASKRDVRSLLNVFLVGSRAWGTETPDSDWYESFASFLPSMQLLDHICSDSDFFTRDYFVVVQGEETSGPMEMTDDGRINLTIFSEDSWRRWLVRDHNLQGIACLYLPSENVIVNSYDWSKELVIDRKRLRFSAIRKASSSFNRARIYWLAMQDMYYPLPTKRIELTAEDEEAMKGLSKLEAEKKSKKMIVHGLRAVELALQLFEHSKILDLYCARKYWLEIKDITDVEWRYFEDKYETLWKSLSANFPADSAELPGPSSSSLPPFLHRMDYLLSLPPFQSSYREGIAKEMYHLLRLVKLSATPNASTSKHLANVDSEELLAKPLKEHFEQHFPKYPILNDVYDECLAHFEKMVRILQIDFDSLLLAAKALVEANGTKIPRELAALSKGIATHYTLLFGISKTNPMTAEQYLLICPWTHFDIMDEYAKGNPAPMVWKASSNESSNSNDASSSANP